MKRYTLLAAMAIVLGGCAQLPEIADHSKPGNTKPDGDSSTHTNASTNLAGDKSGVRQMIELRVIDDEMRVKLGLNNADDMLVTLTNDANKTQHTVLYVSRDLDEEFMAAPDEFIHSKKLEKFVQIFALSEAQAPTANPDRLMPARLMPASLRAEAAPVPSAKKQSFATSRVICKRRADGKGGWIWIPQPPCPL